MARLEEAISGTPDGVIDEICPDEEMYWPGREEAYFAAGRSALRAIRLGQLAAAQVSPGGSSTCHADTGVSCGC